MRNTFEISKIFWNYFNNDQQILDLNFTKRKKKHLCTYILRYTM